MTTELDIATNNRLAVARPLPQRDPIDNLERYARAIETAYDFAGKLCRTGLVPKAYQGKPADGAVAILHGAELGLNPIQSLQQIFPVHGQPSMYARTMVALLKSKGYKFKTVEAGPARVTIHGWWPGDEEPETSTWTIERAIAAGFVPQTDPDTGQFKVNQYGKLIGNEKYLTQPEEMLWAKAAGTVCRRLAPDVLLGIAHTAEDLESEPAPGPVRVTSERVVPEAEATPVVGVPVQQWQPPTTEPDNEGETASNPGAKPDTAQVAPPALAEELVVEYATAAEQRALSGELERHGHKTAAAKRKWLSADTGREIASAKELTSDEANRIVARLEERESGDMPILQSQWDNAAAMLVQLGADTEDKKVMFLRNFLNREEIRHPLDLNEREAAEILAELTQLLADEAAAATQLPTTLEGGE